MAHQPLTACCETGRREVERKVRVRWEMAGGGGEDTRRRCYRAGRNDARVAGVVAVAPDVRGCPSGEMFGLKKRA
jgi:hypothetical protein